MTNSLPDTALTLFRAAIDRADPAAAVTRQLTKAPLPAPKGRRIVIAVGKAAVPMMRATLAALPEAPAAALVVTNPENRADLPGAEVIAGAHPVPDQSSAGAGARVLDLLSGLKAEDEVLMLISGGGSALMVAPAEGLTLADKATVNGVLLASGLEINRMNLIRQSLSRLKGGGLLRAAAPARVTALILSDVIGDDLRAIASGPTVAPLGSREEARALLQSEGLWDKLPETVRNHLDTPDAPQATPEAQNILIGSNRFSLEAMQARAEEMGWEVAALIDDLTGDVAEAADRVIDIAAKAPKDRPVALLFGGETTVRLTGSGRGGRNQELALRIAKRASELDGDWVFLSGGTDGRDGPTDAAGGLVTPDTWDSILNAEALLANNDSYAALKAADALVTVGGTGTNVADVQILLKRP
ncbi:glycerate kinase type-2 family protein [Arenibacterium sp. LLYu02]|uniref:glycerate kinase type-2 family protein n=1 Tax=Arenibacterium sp. LLYu02 TaxID=3404132 RepID=UPI003B21C366